MKPCAVIPVYEHAATVGQVVAALHAVPLSCILVDDGSGAECARVLVGLQAAAPQHTQLVRLSLNQGKGAAVMAGLRAAHAAGFTHALQIDADAQHDVGDAPAFLATGAREPDALICGYPIFDASVPKARLHGRRLTNVWVHINTLSHAVRDAMCGLRLYPLAPTVALVDAVRLGRRMEFDIEILVRLVWRGMRIVNLPAHVRYPQGGRSHFRMFRDNVRISLMHARLFLGMLLRLPLLLARRARGVPA